MDETPKSISELANKLNEKPSYIRNTLNKMNNKLYGSGNKNKSVFTAMRNK